MARTIWKFPLDCNSVVGSQHRTTVKSPAGSVPLCVMRQDGRVFVWMEVDPDERLTEYDFFVIGTGHGAVPDGRQYLGSVIDGAYVWHVYK